MDISDGLFLDLEKLSNSSNIGFEFFKEIKEEVGISGEEYEILFSCNQKNLKKIENIAKKYEIKLIDKQLFAFAGLWSEWTDKATGEQINTYTILTTQANKLLSEIHNSKKRMPVILSKENETNWLLGAPPLLLNEELIAEKI